MKRRLLIANLLLVALVAWGAMRIRRQYLEAREHEQAVLNRRVAPLPAPPQPSVAPTRPVTGGEYIDIAQKMLFSKDRNPTVIVEAPAPPPKPMPPLPIFHGLMNFPDGPTVILSEKPNARHAGYKIGDRIGEFTLMAVDSREISFEWDGQTVTRLSSELEDHSAPAQVASADTTPRTPSSSPSPEAPKPKGQAAPGAPAGERTRACQPGDDSPAGTVADGMRKVLTPTPFGQSCRWEPI